MEVNHIVVLFCFILSTLLSVFVQMPRGVPVATVAINNATNAGLLAVRMLGVANPDLVARLGPLNLFVVIY